MSAVFHLLSVALVGAAFACWYARTPLGPAVQDALGLHLLVLGVASSITAFMLGGAADRQGRGLRLSVGVDVLAALMFATAAGFGFAEAFGLHDTPAWIYGVLWGAGLISLLTGLWLRIVQVAPPKRTRRA